MARRKRSSIAEDMIDLVALLPWYVGVVAAIVTYVAFHHVEASALPSAPGPGNMSAVMVGAVWRAAATGAQYFVPVIFLLGAAGSAWRRYQRRELLDTATASESSDSLDGMSWREFEMLVGEGFRLQGYTVIENGGPGPDGGIDLTLRKGGEKYLVQCKQWRAFKVGVPIVRELYGAMAAAGAAGGFLVTSGKFTAEAKEFASGRNVRLLDGPMLHKLLRHSGNERARQPVAAVREAQPVAQTAQAEIPNCPKCTLPMVRRTAKRGANAGNEFWGCSDYPRCRGTV